MVLNIYVREVFLRIMYVLGSVIGTMVGVYVYAGEFYYILVEPLIKVSGIDLFLYTTVFEVLFVYLKLSLISGFFVFILMSILNLYLYSISISCKSVVYLRKKKIILGFTLIFLYMSVIYKFFLVFLFNYVLDLSIGNNGLEYSLEPWVSEYLSLILNLLVFLLAIFVVPLLIFLYYKNWKDFLLKLRDWWLWFYVWVSCMIILFIPPDMLLHIAIFMLITIIYEIFLFSMYINREYLLE